MERSIFSLSLLSSIGKRTLRILRLLHLYYALNLIMNIMKANLAAIIKLKVIHGQKGFSKKNIKNKNKEAVALSDIEIYQKILIKFVPDHSKVTESSKNKTYFDKNQPKLTSCFKFVVILPMASSFCFNMTSLQILNAKEYNASLPCKLTNVRQNITNMTFEIRSFPLAKLNRLKQLNTSGRDFETL